MTQKNEPAEGMPQGSDALCLPTGSESPRLPSAEILMNVVSLAHALASCAEHYLRQGNPSDAQQVLKVLVNILRDARNGSAYTSPRLTTADGRGHTST